MIPSNHPKNGSTTNQTMQQVNNWNKDIGKMVGLTVNTPLNSVSESIFKRAMKWHEDREGAKALQKLKLFVESPTIHGIIMQRRSEHAASFGNKYFKDQMDNPNLHPALWCACAIPRVLTGVLYATSKISIPYIGRGWWNPLSYVGGLLACIAMMCPISKNAKLEQAIRTHIEGTEVIVRTKEETTLPDFIKNRTVYDKYKEYQNDGQIPIYPCANGFGELQGAGYFKNPEENWSISEVEGDIQNKLNSLKKTRSECLALLPACQNKPWFQRMERYIKFLEDNISNEGT